MKASLFSCWLRKGVPPGFVGVRPYHEPLRIRAQGPSSTVLITFLGRGQQWVQHLDRRLIDTRRISIKPPGWRGTVRQK